MRAVLTKFVPPQACFAQEKAQKKVSGKTDTSILLLYENYLLCSRVDCFRRANVCTRSTLRASFGVNRILVTF